MRGHAAIDRVRMVVDGVTRSVRQILAGREFVRHGSAGELESLKVGQFVEANVASRCAILGGPVTGDVE